MCAQGSKLTPWKALVLFKTSDRCSEVYTYILVVSGLGEFDCSEVHIYSKLSHVFVN